MFLKFPFYRVGTKSGRVPNGYKCRINGWHFKKNKVFLEGYITFDKDKDGGFEIIGNILDESYWFLY